MIPTAPNPAGLYRAGPFSAFVARFVLVVLAATAAFILALHMLAPGSASTPLANDANDGTSQVASHPTEFVQFPGNPY